MTGGGRTDKRKPLIEIRSRIDQLYFAFLCFLVQMFKKKNTNRRKKEHKSKTERKPFIARYIKWRPRIEPGNLQDVSLLLDECYNPMGKKLRNSKNV